MLDIGIEFELSYINVALASGSLYFVCHVALSHDIVDSLFCNGGEKSCGVYVSITVCFSCDTSSATLVDWSMSCKIMYDMQSYLQY